MVAAKMLCDTLKPLLAKDPMATPLIARIKSMVMAAALQQHQEANRAPSISRAASSRHPNTWERAQGSQLRSKGTQNPIGHIHDAHKVLDAR